MLCDPDQLEEMQRKVANELCFGVGMIEEILTEQRYNDARYFYNKILEIEEADNKPPTLSSSAIRKLDIIFQRSASLLMNTPINNDLLKKSPASERLRKDFLDYIARGKKLNTSQMVYTDSLEL